MFTRGRIALSAIVIAGLALAGCSPAGESASESKANTATSAAAPSTVAHADVEDSVTFTNAFVRAKGTDKDMTGIFGVFHNFSDHEVNVVGFKADFDDAKYEVHEVVDGVMREKEGGIVIPAGGTHELVPGGDHLMILDHKEEIPAGGEINLVIELGDGTTIEVPNVPVRTINSGDENYGADGELVGHAPAHGSN
ncbi:hypothetical protein CATRI_07305 [Corynebacterium atrinae]|uniref:copper chaperone PCu(A)C n=1 Tax=Corynebacterium atrinae TaxID=1336740 RepID=UPI0025B5E86C|nr:copper chaperone PCu(A)C [Corynebacterium atrinae]WJY63542.1 hypothetical protein CATRI_07305 [Corynebacterium atrinae]